MAKWTTMMMALFFFCKTKAWRSTSAPRNCIKYHDFRNDYPITSIEPITHQITHQMTTQTTHQTTTQITQTDKSKNPTPTLILQPTPFKSIKSDNLKRFLLKRGLDWIVKAMVP